MRGRVRFLLLLGLICVSSTACSFKGTIRENFYQPAAQQEQKLPLKVALVVDKSAKSQQFEMTQGLYTWNIDLDLYGALSNAVKAELGMFFEQVTQVDDARQAQDSDLVAFAELKLKGGLSGSMTPTSTIESRMKLSFKGTKSKETISKFEGAETVNAKILGSVFANHMLTFLSFGILSPVTLPAMARAEGEHAIELLEVSIPHIIQTIASDMRDDRDMALFAKNPSGVPPAAVAAAPQRVIPVSDVDTLPAVKSSRSKKNAYAVVVGIERYREKLPTADYADRDAKLVGQYLTKVLGYEEENVVVRVNEKAGRTDIEKYVETWLPNRVEKGDTVFVYFSGHGAPNAKTGEAFLVPYDGDPTFVDTTGYPLKRLYENLAKLPAGEVVVVLDSCFSGAGGRSVIAKGSRPMVLSVENPVLAKGKMVVLSASSGEQVSSTYEKQGHGLLTYFFLKGLHGEADRNKDGAIDLAEIFDYLRPQVERVARREFNNEQTPQLAGSPEMLSKGIRLLEK